MHIDGYAIIIDCHWYCLSRSSFVQQRSIKVNGVIKPLHSYHFAVIDCFAFCCRIISWKLSCILSVFFQAYRSAERKIENGQQKWWVKKFFGGLSIFHFYFFDYCDNCYLSPASFYTNKKSWF